MAQDTIKAWSFSSLQKYEQCPYQAKLAKIDKIPEPERPAPPNGDEHANDRGSRIHDHAEAYVRGDTGTMLPEMLHFKQGFENLRQLFKKNKVELEDMWCFDDAWEPVASNAWDEIWARIKLDAVAFIGEDESHAAVIDYKTGKKFGNEVKHGQQLQLYCIGTALLYPEVETITAELWYLDKDELTSMTFSRRQALRFMRGFNERAVKMTTDTQFKPKPNKSSCMFCPYGPKEFSNKWVNKSGHCEFGVN